MTAAKDKEDLEHVQRHPPPDWMLLDLMLLDMLMSEHDGWQLLRCFSADLVAQIIINKLDVFT